MAPARVGSTGDICASCVPCLNACAPGIPEAYLMTENCGDIYSAYCWGSLTWNGDTFDEFFNLFKYTFPEYVQVNMVDPRGWVG